MRREIPVGIRRIAPWAVFVVVLALILPMASYLRDRAAREQSSAVEGREPGPVFDVGAVYEAERVMSIGLGDGPGEIAMRDGEPSFEAVVPASGGRLWLVDHPESTGSEARVRLLDAQGGVMATFATAVGGTLFTAGGAEDLWVDVAAGGGKIEMLVHYDASGAITGEYPLPPEVYARTVCVAPTGAVYVQSEEWILDTTAETAIYSSYLVPIVDAAGVAVESPLDKAVQASFIGADGWFYQLDGTIPTSVEEYPEFRVIARDPDGTDARAYQVTAGMKPYAADAAGLIYAAPRLPVQPNSPGSSSLGDAAGEVAMVGVYDTGGHVATLPAAWPIGVNQWYPPTIPMADGTLVSVVWERGALGVYRLRPTGDVANSAAADVGEPDAGVLVSATMPYCGDPYLAEDAAQRDLWQLVYSGLVSRDASSSPVPDLAVAVPAPGAGVSDDGLTVTWTIAAGRTWHDGRPVTPADVVATYKHLRAATPIGRAEPFPGFDLIAGVVADGDRVIVTLAEPFGPAPEAFFPFVLPAHVIDGAGVNGGLFSAPVGSGPYRLERWETGGYWALSAHDGWLAAPAIRRLDVEFVTSEAATEALMASSAPVVAVGVSEADAVTLRRDAIGSVEQSNTGRWLGAVVNTSQRYLRDQRVRRALLGVHPYGDIQSLYGLDEPFMDSAAPFEGAVASAGETTLTAGAAAASLEAAGWRRTASSLVDAAGEAMALRYELTVRAGAKDEFLSEQVDAVLAAWGDLGVNGSWNYSRPNYYSAVDQRGYLSGARYAIGAGVFPGFVDPAWGSVFDPADTPSFQSPRGRSVTFIEDPVLERLHAEVRAIYDPAQRREIGVAVRARVVELGLAVFERPETRITVTRGVAGVEAGPYPAGVFWNAGTWSLEDSR